MSNTHPTPEFHIVTVNEFSKLTGKIFVDTAVNADDTIQVHINKADLVDQLKRSGYTHVEYFVLPDATLFMNAMTQEVN